MADLNDFFARKDKKKPKNTKYTTLNNIDQKLKEMDLKRQKAQSLNSDDGWKRFEERKIDYTGLKIQNSTLHEDESDDESEKDTEETSCPWNTVTQSQGPLGEENKTVKKETQTWKTVETPVQLEKPAPTVKAYIPPHLRNKPAPPQPALQTATASQRFKGLRDENVENMFPSLPSTEFASVWENQTKVHESHCQNTVLKLATENRFGIFNNNNE